MADIDYTELRAITNAATSGPWYQGRDDRRYESSNEAYTREDPHAEESYDVWPDQGRPEDAAFVVAARDAVPALLDLRDAVLAYARERQAYGSRGTVGSLRIASDLLQILGEPWDTPSLEERGRQLASQREDLIAQGVDPALLEVPLHPEPTDALPEEKP